MGQAWCREKSTKAQDSKSSLDRVFVRCAHRIYPGLKEEGSVLGGGGATQRVTSSEIGYAGSPPRASLLQRGQSIDSVDRPFHPSDWVDVNLEVPCTPRASVIGVLGQRRASDAAKGSKSNNKEKTPVPPPRRRRRTRDRPLPPKPGLGDTADEESEAEPEPLYSKLSSKPRPVQQEVESTDEVDGGMHEDSDEEFVAIERSLKKSSLQDVSTTPKTPEKANNISVRPKNHCTTSLPNVADLLAESANPDETSLSAPEDEGAKRPPRHVKTASLPRDALLCAPQTPERTVFPKRTIEEAQQQNSSKASDNSIFEEATSPDCSQLGFEADVETSTPVKSKEDESVEETIESRDETFESCKETSKSTEESSSSLAIPQDVDRPNSAAAADESRRSEDDVGYESRSPTAGSHPFSDGSSEVRAGLFQEESEGEMSSGILQDAAVDSTNSSQLNRSDNNAAVVGVLQRTISEESLPCEMLVDVELDDDDEDDRDNDEPEVVAEEKSVKDASNQLTRQISTNENESFKTPPPTPERAPTTNGPAVIDPQPANSAAVDEGNNNPSSMTPSLMELEAALTDMLERKDEAEREEDDVSSPEPQIVPVTMTTTTPGGGGLRRLSPQTERKREQEWSSRPIDFHRQNPFNELADECNRDLNSSTDEPPEKPHRLHRISLIEDSSIDEPLIVPTPPKRRHRSKSSNLNSSTDSAVIPTLHTYASGDRLI